MDIVKIAIDLALIVVLIARKVNLTITLVVSALVLGLMAGMSPAELLATSWRAVASPQTWQLALAIYLVLMLGTLMKRTEAFSKALQALGTIFSDPRVSLAAIPSLIGLLPVLGGAILSAPAVEEIGRKLHMSPEQKTFVNYWFRHVWEYIWPLYPGLIVASGILGVSVYKLTLYQLPLTLTAILAGTFLELRRIAPGGRATGASASAASIEQAATAENDCEEREPSTKDSMIQLAIATSPIAIVVVLVFLLKLELAIALFISVLAYGAFQKVGMKELALTFKKSFSFETVVLVFGVLIFKEVFDASNLAGSLPETFTRLGIPIGLLLFVLPFIIGLMTGVTIGFVGLAFPILLPWLVPGGNPNLTSVALAYAGGFAGVLLSPVHLCLVLTREYFKADFRQVYWKIIKAAAFVVATALIMYLVW